MRLTSKDLVFLDFETVSDLDIRKVGAYKYIQSKGFKVLCGVANGKLTNLKSLHAIINSGKTIVAHNAPFEIMVLERLGLDVSKTKFICTATLSRFFGGPSSLYDCTTYWKLPVKKWVKGRNLIKYFMEHDENHEDYAECLKDLKKYCKIDVETTKCLYDTIMPLVEENLKVMEKEMTYFDDTMKINKKGIPVDLDYTEKLIEVRDTYMKKTKEYFIKKYDFNPNSSHQTLKWLDNGFISSGKKYVMTNWKRLNDKQKEMFELKWSLLSPQAKKLDFIIRGNEQGFLKWTLLHFGAKTGRYTSRDINILNFPKGIAEKSTKDLETLLQREKLNSGKRILESLKGVVKPKDDQQIVLFDYKQIEFRLLMWKCGYPEVLDKLERGEDLYIEFAEKIFGKGKVEKGSVERQIGKAGVLSLGYGASPNLLVNILSSFIPNPDYKLAQKVWTTYHKTFPKVQKAYYQLNKIIYGGRNFLNLPNGQKRFIIPYPSKRPINEINVIKNGAALKQRITPNLLMATYIQSTARELIFEKQNELIKKGYTPIFGVYDSLVFVLNKDDEKSIKEIKETMEQPVEWLPNYKPEVDTTIEERWGINGG